MLLFLLLLFVTSKKNVLILSDTASTFNAFIKSTRISVLPPMSKPKVLSSDEAENSIQPLMQLASAHFAPQALHTVVQLGIPNLVGDGTKTVGEIAQLLSSSKGAQINEDALLRTMRLLTAVGIFDEDPVVVSGREGAPSFGLTSTGALLQTEVPGQRSLAPVIQHWMERPLWNAWSELPSYIAGEGGADLPFDRANGISSDEFYGEGNPQSLQYANEFVRFISTGEEAAVLNGFDWNMLSGKTVIDIGGHQGKIMGLVAEKFPNVECLCLDLPEVISKVTDPPPGVKLIGGDILDGGIPACDAIFMKHFLDKCMWNENQSVQILKSCHSALPDDGRVIIGEAVLPDNAANAKGTNRLHLFIDVLFLLVGRDAARTETEWRKLAEKAGFSIETITATSSPSCYIIVLGKVCDIT